MTVFGLSMRQLTTGSRWAILALVTALPPLLGTMDAVSVNEVDFMTDAFPDVILGVIVPLIPLLLASSLFANDVEDGTIVYLLVTPTARRTILLERWAATVLVAMTLTLASTLSTLAVQSTRVDFDSTFLLAVSAAVAAGTLVYTSLFTLPSLLTKRGILIGLLYVIIWEGMLAAQFAGTRTLSVKEYILTIAAALDRSDLAAASGSVSALAALVSSVMVIVLSLALADRRLRHHEGVAQL